MFKLLENAADPCLSFIAFALKAFWEVGRRHNIDGRSYWLVWKLNPLLELHHRLGPYSKSLRSLQDHQDPLPVTVGNGLISVYSS